MWGFDELKMLCEGGVGRGWGCCTVLFAVLWVLKERKGSEEMRTCCWITRGHEVRNFFSPPQPFPFPGEMNLGLMQ